MNDDIFFASNGKAYLTENIESFNFFDSNNNKSANTIFEQNFKWSLNENALNTSANYFGNDENLDFDSLLQ
jgi:hypothetical protein